MKIEIEVTENGSVIKVDNELYGVAESVTGLINKIKKICITVGNVKLSRQKPKKITVK